MRPLVALCALLTVYVIPAFAEKLDYSVADPELKVVLLDQSPTESFLAVQADTTGRLFVGGREALFVYEPKPNGGYGPRKELYRFPAHTWVYDVAIRGDDLYILTVPALYVLPGARLQREGIKPKRLIWGVPLGHVHQCFHGMTPGPEGDIYFAMGDPLWYYGDFARPDHWGYWTFFSQPEGTPTPYTGVGGVFRCKPDGTDFKVVARGLRNPCGIAFDQHWNLFANDNDHEGMPAEYVPGKLVHVTPHSYHSWPRGWMAEKSPDRADLLETMFDGMGRAVPVGQAYYHDPFLPEAYRNNLLVARWCTRAVTRYPIRKRGASFACEEHSILNGRNQARPVGVSVGRGGRIFATIAYMAHNDASPTYRSDLVMITRADDPDTHPFEAYDAPTASDNKLWEELSSPFWSRRQQAHTEILRRGGTLLTDAVARLRECKPDDPAYHCLLWLAGAAGSTGASDNLNQLAANADAAVRKQAIRVLDAFPKLNAGREQFVAAIVDPDPQTKHAALTALGNRAGNMPRSVVEAAGSEDTYLRQTAALLLANQAEMEPIAELCRASSPATRLAGVLAAGFRLTIPPLHEPIAKNLPLDKFRDESVYTITFADGTVDLRKLGQLGIFTVADHWKAGKHTEEQEKLFTLLESALKDTDERVRLQAVHFLSLLKDPRSEPLVAKVIQETEDRRLAVGDVRTVQSAWVTGPFPDGDRGFKAIHPPEQGAVDLSAQYSLSDRLNSWSQARVTRMYQLNELTAPATNASYYAYCRLESAKAQPILLLVGSDDGVKVWRNGELVWTNDISRGALPFQDAIKLYLQPGSNDLLVRVRNQSGDCGLYLHYRTMGGVEPTVPEKLGLAGLADRLRSATGTSAVPPELLAVDWSTAVKGGDPERGKKLFGADGIGCIKCHAVQADQAGTFGPSLADAHKRFTLANLVEAVLLPSKQVSPVFRTTVIATTSGEQLTGLIVGETAEKVELLLPDATRRAIDRKEIEVRREQADVSPMPGGLIKKPEELRDILAYLLQPREGGQ